MYGVISSLSGDIIVEGGEPDPIGDPTVTKVYPATSVVLHQYDPVSIDVTYDGPGIEVKFVVAVRFATRATEVVHDGYSFRNIYTGSTRTTIEGGYRYTITRLGGWPEAPVFEAIPSTGDEGEWQV